MHSGLTDQKIHQKKIVVASLLFKRELRVFGYGAGIPDHDAEQTGLRTEASVCAGKCEHIRSNGKAYRFLLTGLQCHLSEAL